MKAAILASLLLTGAFVHAETEEVSIERSRQVVSLTIPLNTKTVRCLLGDYGSQSLKISMDQLRAYTMFPQTTRGETAPCINAGSCVFDTAPDGRRLGPELILDAERPTETVAVTIVLNEVLQIDHLNRKCSRSLQEDVSATVRALDFRHSDGASLGSLKYEDCLQLQKSKFI